MANPPASEHATVQLMCGVAQILLRLGIDAPNAGRLLRSAFVLAARDKARFSGASGTQSQIASMAGISRLEVRTILAEKPDSTARRQLTRINQLIAAWRSDPAFLDARRRPKSLELKGKRGTFEHLVKMHGRDVTSKTLRDELTSRGIAALRNRKIHLQRRGDRSRSEIVAAESDLRFLISQLDGINLHSGRRTYVSRRVSVEAHDRKAIQVLKAIALSRIETVLSSISEISSRPVRRLTKKNPRAKRMVITATVASETGD